MFANMKVGTKLIAGFLALALIGAVVDKTTGAVVVGPEILSRGFIYMREADGLIQMAKECVEEVLTQDGTLSARSNTVRDSLAAFIYKQTRRRPMIMPVILEL